MLQQPGNDALQTRAEQVRTLYSLAPTAVAAGMGVASLVLVFSWPVAPHKYWVIWFLGLVVVSLLRLQLVRRFQKVSPPAEDIPVWERRFNLGTVVAGCVWGLLALLLDLSWPAPNQILIYVALLGMASGALATDGVLSRTFMLFATPVVAPIALLLANIGDGSHLGMAALVGLYLTMLYYASGGYQRNLERSLALQHRNAALLDSLSETNAGLQAEVNERKRAEAALFQEKERAEITLHSIADAVVTTDEGGNVAYLNPVAEKLTGWPIDEAQGRPLSEVFCVEEVASDEVTPPSVDALRQERGERLLLGRGGTVSTITHTSAPITAPGGRMLGNVLVFQDVTPLRNMAQEMAYHATHDPLTGLINRREFELRLSLALEGAQKRGEHHVLLYLDLDQFKVVNDTCGHRAGDELLHQLSVVLLGSLRRTDVLGRLGGDEFGVLLQNCPLEVGERIAEDIRSAVSSFRFSWDDKVFTIGTSIGVVPIEAADASVSELLSAADVACYTAKDLGRNRVHVYEPKDEELARRQGEMQWISRITDAQEHHRLVLYYQEIARITGKEDNVRQMEILLRMRDEQGKLVPPDAFLPAAERYNLMPSLDRWVIEHAFAWCQAHGSANLVCSINLSGTSLNDAGLMPFIRAQFETTGVPARQICFEITETAAVANLGAASALIQELRAMGCQFALDDFGSGLSSFNYLKNLPVDIIKIDGGFVRDIATDPVDRAMVAAINTLAHVMGKQTIAEFAETEEIVAQLMEMGVDFAQGYCIGKPAPLQDSPHLVGHVAAIKNSA
jgi:diguanylate cyclase (GGDEF)-like protein/PAS domain S-box-containing protein